MLSDAILTRLQDDVYQMLLQVPSLATASVLTDDVGDLENAAARALQNLSPGGKCGLAVVVMLPEIVSGDKNLPGPLMMGRVEIQIVEQVLLNRDAARGTLVRSSTAALRVLAALHHAVLGDALLYAEADPVKPLPVKAGHVSHVVRLHCRLDGIAIPPKCTDIGATISGSTLTLTCASAGAAIWYTEEGSYPTPGNAGASLYAAPLTVGPGATIRAAAYLANYNPGNVLELSISA